MDAEHRHELKSNELAEGLKHLPDWLKDNANTIIGVTLIAIALITWPMLNKMSREKDISEQIATTQKIQGLEKDIYSVLSAPADDYMAKTEALNTLLTNAETLLDESDQVENPNLAALAQIKAAQAIRTELHLRPDVETQTLDEQIEKAQAAYEKALQIAKIPSLKGMAQLGLGLCAEELGQADQATDIYNEIVANETFASTVLPALAQQRLNGLEENMETVTFAAAAVTEEPATAEIEADTTEAAITTNEEPVEISADQISEPEATEKTAEVPVSDE